MTATPFDVRLHRQQVRNHDYACQVAATATRPILVGEVNPYSSAPEYALWHEPRGASGDRLCRQVFGLDGDAYEREFHRVNLCAGKWSLRVARQAAEAIESHDGRVLVLLGRKVWSAFGFDRNDGGTITQPFTAKFAMGNAFAFLPHPSGRCREWNSPDAIDRARRAVDRACGLVGMESPL